MYYIILRYVINGIVLKNEKYCEECQTDIFIQILKIVFNYWEYKAIRLKNNK